MNLGKEVSVKFCQELYTVVAMVYPKVLIELLLQNVSPNGAKQQGRLLRIISYENTSYLIYTSKLLLGQKCAVKWKEQDLFPPNFSHAVKLEKPENLIMIRKAYWLMKHEVAHTTNYESLVELCTDLDESNHLANWQRLRAKYATYKSLATCLEMVSTIGEFIDAKMVSELSNSSFLYLMADEATNLRNRIELSVCLCYLTIAGCTNECCVDLLCVPSETAEVVTDGIISIIES